MKRIFHVDLDAFFASVEQRDNPKLCGKPVIVGADPKGGKGRGVVSTCSYEARKFGIHSAMPISKAYQLCPVAIFIEPNFQKYSIASENVFKIFYDFTPHIEGVGLDEAFLDITTSAHLFGGPLQMAKCLKERIYQEVGLIASVGIAPVKMVAKIASDLSKPNGLLEVLDGQVEEFLRPLKIQRLWGVGPKTAEVLHQMGIQTIGDLGRIPLGQMQNKFGESGTHLYNLSHGIDLRDVIEETQIKSVSHEHTFTVDTANCEEVLAIMLQLSQQVSRRLRKYSLKGKTITVKMRLHGFVTYTRAVTLGEGTNFADVIFRTAKEIFVKFFKPGMKVRLIGVKVNNFSGAYVQENLFSDPADERRERIHSVVDLIKDKFGEDAIGRGK